jgi:hypothetical protein
MTAASKPSGDDRHESKSSWGGSGRLQEILTKYQPPANAGASEELDVKIVEVEQTVTQLLATQPMSIRSRAMRVALDSGAGDHVASPHDVEGFAIVPSEYSKAGRNFVAANGGKIINHGEATMKMKNEKGKKIASTFQVADVTRPLYSVSKLCDAGYKVEFDGDEAVVTRKKTGKVVQSFKREGGLYVTEVHVGDDGGQLASTFVRQGAHA